MIDYASYRVRIGLHNNKRCGSTNLKNKFGINGSKMLKWKYTIILLIGIFCVSPWYLTQTDTNFCATSFSERHNFVSLATSDAGCKILFSRISPKEWNSEMRALNGNRSNRLNIAHWNGGSSHLGKSSKGK